MLRVRSLSLGAFGAARDRGLDLKGSDFPLFCAALFRQGTADGGAMYSASWAVWLLLFLDTMVITAGDAMLLGALCQAIVLSFFSSVRYT